MITCWRTPGPVPNKETGSQKYSRGGSLLQPLEPAELNAQPGQTPAGLEHEHTLVPAERTAFTDPPFPDAPLNADLDPIYAGVPTAPAAQFPTFRPNPQLNLTPREPTDPTGGAKTITEQDGPWMTERRPAPCFGP